LDDGEFKAQLKRIFVAESARAAQIMAQKRQATRKALGTIAIVGLAGFIGIGLLQKLVTRGKF
jgi:hypothetical protein